ncbi:glutathione-regulated potassium-efflux system kefB domain protein, partial [Yersinia pestis PY-15]
MAKKIN